MKEAKKVKIELLEPHTDAGREYPPGTELELLEEQADWLVKLKKAKLATTKPGVAQ